MARKKKAGDSEKYECKTEESADTGTQAAQEQVSEIQEVPVAHPQEFPVIEEVPVVEETPDRQAIRRRFGPYRPPTDETKPKFKTIQEAALRFAEVILDTCPDCQQRSAAFTLLEQAKMLANASIAIHCHPTTAKKGIQV